MLRRRPPEGDDVSRAGALSSAFSDGRVCLAVSRSSCADTVWLGAEGGNMPPNGSPRVLKSSSGLGDCAKSFEVMEDDKGLGVTGREASLSCWTSRGSGGSVDGLLCRGLPLMPLRLGAVGGWESTSIASDRGSVGGGDALAESDGPDGLTLLTTSGRATLRRHIIFSTRIYIAVHITRTLQHFA